MFKMFVSRDKYARQRRPFFTFDMLYVLGRSLEPFGRYHGDVQTDMGYDVNVLI